MKQVMLIFRARRLFSLENGQMCPQNSFSQFFPKIRFFFEKIVLLKNIQHLICDKKGYIHFWCNIIPYLSHSNPATVGQRNEGLKRGGEPLLLRSEISLFLLPSFSRNFPFWIVVALLLSSLLFVFKFRPMIIR